MLQPIDATSEDGEILKATDGDFYLENGLLIFTAAYHLRRGDCCSSGCRHCP